MYKNHLENLLHLPGIRKCTFRINQKAGTSKHIVKSFPEIPFFKSCVIVQQINIINALKIPELPHPHLLTMKCSTNEIKKIKKIKLIFIDIYHIVQNPRRGCRRVSNFCMAPWGRFSFFFSFFLKILEGGQLEF